MSDVLYPGIVGAFEFCLPAGSIGEKAFAIAHAQIQQGFGGLTISYGDLGAEGVLTKRKDFPAALQ